MNSPANPANQSTHLRERRFATDFFMIVAYSLLGAAMIAQLFLILWLDAV